MLLTRRRALKLSLLGPGAAWGLQGCATAPGAASWPAQGNPAALLHFVDRLGWGATDKDLQRCAAVGPAAFLAQQLAPRPATLPAAAQAQVDSLALARQPLADTLARFETLRKQAAAASPDAKADAQKNLQQLQQQAARETATRHVLRALYSPDQLRERLTWFWFNHFNVFQYKHQVRLLLSDYEERAIRPHVFGRFRDLLGAATRHPAMLQYLDNTQNTAQGLNENHARELLELHTLGVEGGYTQRDVQELARVLSGHGVNLAATPLRVKPAWQALVQRDGAYEFNPARHDFGDKRVLGQAVRGSGADELDHVLDALAVHPATTRRLALKLARFLVSEAPAPALVDAAAAALAHGSMGDAVVVLVGSPAFAQDPKPLFKDPVSLVFSSLRALWADQVVANPGPVLGWLNQLGQGLYNRSTPDGYPALAQDWNSSGQLASRFDVARAMGTGVGSLFPKGADAAPPPTLPDLSRGWLGGAWLAQAAPATRQMLQPMRHGPEWNALALASPDFMVR